MNRRRRRQRKRLISMILIVVALVLIVLCAVLYILKNNANENEINTDSTVETTIDEEETNDDVNQQTVDTAVEDPYENIINGKGKIAFDYYLDNIYANEPYGSYEGDLINSLPTKESTLPDLVDSMNTIFEDPDQYYNGGEVSSVSYAYLDCGNDGNKELALNFVCPVVEEGSYMTMILKEIDDKVQVVYIFCGWSRSETSINEYGYISGGGSGGATLHVSDCSYINADGEYCYGYSEEEQADLASFAEFKDHTDYDTSALNGTIVVYSLRTTPTTSEDYEPQYYSYLVYDDNYNEMSVDNLYTDSEYKMVMDSFTGIDFVSYDELQQIENDKLSEIGVTDTIKNGKELEYTEIKL
ncbi:MAG: hypothetical protein K6E79_09040 [Pseudobutyrivibrio sp.]|nr:hypothetical protein [Pseudobutyrivibrio sp.]